MGAILEGVPGCAATGSASSECNKQCRAILNHRFQLTGLLSRDGRLIMANKVALEFAGVRESEVSGKLFWECPWWTHSMENQNKLKTAIKDAAAGESVRFETTHLDKNGDLCHIDFSLSPVFNERGEVVYLVPEGLEITEAKKREAAWRESEERYRILAETASDSIFMMNWDIFVECNQKTLDILQYERKEIIGRSILDFSPSEQLDGVDSGREMMEKIKAALRGQPQRFGYNLLQSTGAPFEVELSLNRIDLSTGPHIIGRLKDVTERNRIEKERNDLQERFQQSRKMEAIGTLAAGIAHDFNNILAPIIGYAELTMSQADADPAVQKYQHHILQAALRAKELIQQVLAFSRKGDEVIKPVTVKIILKETLKLIRASLPSNIDIVESIGSKGVVLSSPTHIQQVVMNLCSNAGHAMKENGGLLKVELADEVLSEKLADKYADLPPGPYVKLSVGDTGYGIPPEILQQIFDPYFTTKEKGEGTGLGLSMVHGIVKDCGGEILVDSEPGKGTTISVYLPAAPGTGEEERKMSKATPGGSEKILVVDDEKIILLMYNNFLGRLGYSVTTRISSVEALEAFKGNPDAYDLVITDMMMPDMTGDKLAEEISKCRPDIPIVLCTGYSDHIFTKKVEGMAVDALMMKPLIMSDLAVKIRELIDKGRIDPKANKHPYEEV